MYQLLIFFAAAFVTKIIFDYIIHLIKKVARNEINDALIIERNITKKIIDDINQRIK